MKVELTKRELFVLEELISDYACEGPVDDASFSDHSGVILNHSQMENLWEKLVDARFTATLNGEKW